jgi:hypothetical protein
MTAAPGRGQRPIRVGNCSGFYGDRASAMAEMARAGGIDVLTGDYLAEVTMLILGKARAKDPTKGYAATFLLHLAAALEHLVANRIRLVVNAGGLNPGGLAAATRDLIARHGHELRVAHVDGDDVFERLDALQQAGRPLAHLTSGEPLTSWPHQPLTANAYLGGFGIARALDNGADIVITGRVADASLVVGAAAWWGSWTPHDYDALAGAVCAGHVIECGAQATGGNFSGFRSIADLTEPGFPIAEIAADGSSVITKNPGTKVAITGIGGWENSVVFALTGTDLDAKAALVERSVRRYAESVDGIDAIAFDRIGRAQHDPDTQDAATELLRIAVQGTEQAAGRAFSSRMVELALSSYPGLYALGPPQPGSAFGVYWPGLLDQSMLEHTVHHHDGTTEIVVPATAPDAEGTVMPPAEPSLAASAPPSDELVVVPLGELVHARSGDKGGDANLGVWVRERAAGEWLQSTLTVDELRRLLPETRQLAISRYELPSLGAVNFVIRGLLGTGATSTLRLDSQAKALGEWLRSRSTKVPRALVEAATGRSV